MSIPLQLLLRLPPALRCHALTPLLRQPNGSNTSTRLFSKSSQKLQSKPPKPTIRRPQQKPEPNKPPPPPPKPTTSLPKTYVSIPDSILRTFYQSDSTQLLLYKAPTHTSFYFNSYILGSALLTGAIFQGLNYGDPPENLKVEGQRPKRWAQFANGTVAIMFAIFATAFFLAPTKLIKSVSLVKTPIFDVTNTGKGGKRGLVMDFEMKHPLPILQRLPFVTRRGGGVVKAEVGSVFMDREVRASQNLSYFSVPAHLAQAWTEHYFTAKPPQPRSILSVLRGFNSSLVNAWPTLRQDVRRMFMREGFAYVRIPEHGNWKMDLHGCEILEEGQVLEKVVRVDAGQVDRRWWTVFSDKLGVTHAEVEPVHDKAMREIERKGLRAGMKVAAQEGRDAGWKNMEKKWRPRLGDTGRKIVEERAKRQ